MPRLPRKPTTQNACGCEIVPRLPRETKVDVTKCHACQATRARLNQTQARHPVPWMPRLPRKTLVDARLCHACHLKRWWMWGCATPATQNACGCEIVPRLPRETKVDVTECHACHAQCRGVTRDHGAPKPGPRAPPSAMSEAPATQNDHRCAIVPRLPRTVPRRHARPGRA